MAADYILHENLYLYSSIDPRIETSTMYSAGDKVPLEIESDGSPKVYYAQHNGISYSYYRVANEDGTIGMYIPRSISSSYDDMSFYGQAVINVNNPYEQTQTNSEDDTENEIADANSDLTGLEEVQDMFDYSNQQWTNYTQEGSYFDVNNILGIFGLPYQFMAHVDPRLGSSENVRATNTGVDYMDKIVSTMPILFLSPGKPSFMAGYSNDEEKSVLSAMISGNLGGAVNLDDLISENGKFYTFEYAVTDYYKYVNPMCRITARLMNLQGSEYALDGTNVDNFDWRTYTQKTVSSLGDFATDYLAIPFYIDTDTQINESMSNDVTDSSLAGTVDSFSDMGRELMFYLGYTPALAGFDNLSVDIMNNVESLKDYVNSIEGDNIFKTLAQQVTAVATGGRLVFPKIWADSGFSRSYDVNIKLRSPDMDNYSLWLNIIVPLCHILGFTQPHMIEQNPNAFTSPFLVRAMYKGFFNVDMGIISSCSITKGDDAQWNINGIPTSVDVTLTITDLYDSMSITASGGGLENFKFDTLDNTCQMDYLMNLCGINLYKPEINRLIDLWYVTNIENRITDLFGNIWHSLRDSISGAITNIYRGL